MQIKTLLDKINQSLAEIDFQFEKNPELGSEINEAHHYPLLAGGKRIRPLFTLLTAGALGGEKALTTAHNAALAIEMIHTYTLVHDDLPCMDNDDLRRGQPTTHKVYGEAKALLVGDGLLAQAFFILSQTNWQEKPNFIKELLEVLSKAAAPCGVIWGQWLDLSLTGKNSTTWELMEFVHTHKTGVLIAASLELGFICGISQENHDKSISIIENNREKINKIGLLIGLSFQINDDILDATKTTKELGKTAGKDENQNKYTAIRLLGKEKAQDLSHKYTNFAIELLKEIFIEFNDAKNSNEINVYQNLLIQQIQSLLMRLN